MRKSRRDDGFFVGAFFDLCDHRTQNAWAQALQLTMVTIWYILPPQAEILGPSQKQ
jgi:hypothetical protein